MDTGQKTESLAQLVDDIQREAVALPEFQRDFVWDIEKTFDLFDSFAKDIFIGSLIYGVPSFEITVREIDKRPRAGKGSRTKLKLFSYSRKEIEKRVKVNGFRLLLDGQQRATSIFRALTGVDQVYFVCLSEDELDAQAAATPRGKRALEQVLSEFSGDLVRGRVNILLSDVYSTLKGEAQREKEKVALFLRSNEFDGVDNSNAEESPEFETYLTQLKNLENLFRQEKLVSYYLLDTDEEKFALFFERSNSKGVQLNFIDILAAKLYAGFNLRAAIQEFEEANPNLALNREVIVRSISFHVSGGKEMGRAYILSTLTHAHFTEHWARFTAAYKSVHDFLKTSRMVIHPAWMPYENALIPLIAFILKFKHLDFSQISLEQSKLLQTWYWLAIFSRRYSSAAQTYAVEDAQALEKLAEGDFGAVVGIIGKVHSLVNEPEDLLVIHKKYDALYKGVLNLISFHTGGFLNLENNNPISAASNIEDHHIFPNDYLRKNWSEVHDTLDSQIVIDCVVNRTLIPKLTNIKVSNKAPSKYLNELNAVNSDIGVSLQAHLIDEGVLSGEYDKLYDYFLGERASKILEAIVTHVTDPRETILRDYGGSPAT